MLFSSLHMIYKCIFSVGQIFLDDDINRFNQLLSNSQNNGNVLWSTTNNSSVAENVWLVYNKQKLQTNESKPLSHIFRNSPISLDTLVFTFIKERHGMLSYIVE